MRNIALVIVAGIFIGAGTSAVNADQTAVTPPQGSTLLLEVVADGVQVYTCEAKDGGFDWVFKAPEANLFYKQGWQIGSHFGGPTGKPMMVPLLSARSPPKPMHQNQAQSHGFCCAPKAMRGRVPSFRRRLSAGRIPKAA